MYRCLSCRKKLLDSFINGLQSSHRPAAVRGLSASARYVPTRSFAKGPPLRNQSSVSKTSEDPSESLQSGASKEPMLEVEAKVRLARKIFRDDLPKDYLLPEELQLYERLYGPPLRMIDAEEASAVVAAAIRSLSEEQSNGLSDGQSLDAPPHAEIPSSTDLHDEQEERERAFHELNTPTRLENETRREYRARKRLLRNVQHGLDGVSDQGSFGDAAIEETDLEAAESDDMAAVDTESLEIDEQEGEPRPRTHPLTQEGRFRPLYSTTVRMPGLAAATSSLLTGVSVSQLKQVAEQTFGGPRLPNSTATPRSKKGLSQAPIALEAVQTRMGPMEANAFLVANMPGAFASSSAILVEVRRRLGSEWLEALLARPGGPRILDAGSAGAAIFAWQDVVQAEWNRMHPDESNRPPTPKSKATVVAASPELRQRVSAMLDDTTFLPRLPEYHASSQSPAAEADAAAPRKHYDIIVSSYTLWTLRDDISRRRYVSSLWSLLDPNGGVLIIYEKGVPRGFELIAQARASLLKRHIQDPHQPDQAPELGKAEFPKDPGMIVAPCTNHGKCPMAPILGPMTGRKDFCAFEQRFERPTYLNRMYMSKSQNHEDITFSYIAVRRGVDERATQKIVQDEASTQAALAGYEEYSPEQPPNMLSLPRMILPPLKRSKHIIIDLCTPAATAERWIVSKSFSKQAYRDARKSAWGDLWALGAKTRSSRSPRTGRRAPRERRVLKEELEDQEDTHEDEEVD